MNDIIWAEIKVHFKRFKLTKVKMIVELFKCYTYLYSELLFLDNEDIFKIDEKLIKNGLLCGVC